MTDDSTEEMRRQVQERVDAEAAQLSPPEERPKITSKFIHECLFANELGDATLYAALFRDELLFCKNTQEWFIWTGNFWERDVMNRSLAAVEKVVEKYLDEYKLIGEQVMKVSTDTTDPDRPEKLKKLQATQANLLKRVSQLRADKRRTACLKFAHTIEDPLAVKGEEFDNRPMLFPCANGVIDLETGRMKPGRPGDFLSLASPVPFIDIDTPAPIWERSLLEIFGGNSQKKPGSAENERAEEMAAYFNRLFGYAATGLVSEKIFPVLYGKTGWNGRSLIVETISHVMGAMAGSIASEMLISSKFVKGSSGPSPDIISLKGKRFVFASEIEENQRFAVAKIKKLTGKDELVGRSPHDKYESRFAQTHKLFVQTNIQPKAPPNDKSFWERVHLIPFLISFVNRDPQAPHERRAIMDLDRQVLAEASGILAWLVRGCLHWQREGINPPKEVKEATERYRRDEDLLADFIDQCCVISPGAKTKSSVLFDRFKEWYIENISSKKDDVPSGTWFGKQLGQRFEKSKSNGCNIYFGISLAENQGGLEG